MSTSSIALFDDAAPTYDAVFSASLLGRLLRRAVHDEIGGAFRRGDKVLDLGCGTGEDARVFASRGIRVHGIDAAEKMVLRARAKVRLANFEVADLNEDPLPAGPFDGALANFGVVNCLHDRAAFVDRLHAALRPGARVFLVAMGRFCVAECLLHLLRGRPAKAGRRLSGRAEFKGETVFYVRPRELRAEFEPRFRTLRTAAVGILLPPTEAAALIERFPRIALTLDSLDRRIRHWPLAAQLSDHFLIELERL